MLFRAATAEAIGRGEVTCAFRWWRRPTVRAGGTLTMRAGVLAIDEVTPITPGDVTEADARAAGYTDVAALHRDLPPQDGRTLHRVRFHLRGEDPRVALRADDALDEAQLTALAARLAAMDARSSIGPWTRRALEAIEAEPGRRAPDLAVAFGLETLEFKRRIRMLKALGLTESLAVGYRISPRGERVLTHLRSR